MAEQSHTAIARAGSKHVEIDGKEQLRYQVTTPEQASDSDDMTPERLYAAALAACLYQTLVVTATTTGVDITDATATAQVTLDHDRSEGYGLRADISLELPRIDDDARDTVIARTLDACPMIDRVAITVGGERPS
jgi:organic hydroperoxide reductase OsmC/OhrA